MHAATANPTAPSPELVEAIATAQDEPRWLRDHRLRSLEIYRNLSWPSGHEEEWRRTPMQDVPLDRLAVDLAPSSGDEAPPYPTDAAAGVITHADSTVTEQDLRQEIAAQGVLWLPLAAAAREHEALVRAHLNTVATVESDRFIALSAAFGTQNVFAYIPRNVQLSAPLAHRLTKTGSDRDLFGHALVVAEENSAATVVEVAASADAPAVAFLHHTLEIIAGAGAQLRLGRAQHWGTDARAFTTWRAHLGPQAHVVQGAAAFGGTLARDRIDAHLTCVGSRSEIVSVFTGVGRQHIECSALQTLDAERGESDLLIKGALDNDARAVQYGMIRISPGGQRTASQQTLRNLLLSDTSAADPIPVLEIEADDVRCAHAAAVGPVDPEHLFYLQSRGLPADTAERMVVQGFLVVAVDRLPDAALRTLVERWIEERLNAGSMIDTVEVPA